MCREGNSASQSARYLNGQLSTLWENALECIEESPGIDFQCEDYEKTACNRALGQFHFFGKKLARSVASTDDCLFACAFAKPELKFICNHEAVLHLNLQTGQLNLDYGKASAGEYQLDPYVLLYVSQWSTSLTHGLQFSDKDSREYSAGISLRVHA